MLKKLGRYFSNRGVPKIGLWIEECVCYSILSIFPNCFPESSCQRPLESTVWEQVPFLLPGQHRKLLEAKTQCPSRRVPGDWRDSHQLFRDILQPAPSRIHLCSSRLSVPISSTPGVLQKRPLGVPTVVQWVKDWPGLCSSLGSIPSPAQQVKDPAVAQGGGRSQHRSDPLPPRKREHHIPWNLQSN